MHRVKFLFLVGLEYNITQPCKRRWYYLGNILQKCKKSLHFLEFDFFNCSWKNWIVSSFVASLISTIHTFTIRLLTTWLFIQDILLKKRGSISRKNDSTRVQEEGALLSSFLRLFNFVHLKFGPRIFFFTEISNPSCQANKELYLCLARLYI